MAEGLWQRQRKRDKPRQRRDRREWLGELVQADGATMTGWKAAARGWCWW